jgi:hypothetical protein
MEVDNMQRKIMRGAHVAGVTTALVVGAIGFDIRVHAAEGAASHYLPGSIGDFGIALVPEPGLQVANIVWWQSGDVGTTLLQGVVDIGVNVDVVLDLAAANYTSEEPVLGGQYTVGIAIPFGYANLDAMASGPNGLGVGLQADSFNLSDIAITPFQLNWNTGNWHFKVAETVIVPSGAYSTDEVVNLGRNYWSFDNVVALTYLNPARGTEFSVQPGIMFNTENPATRYRTGTEFHVDFVANQFLSKTFAIGIKGYYYQQITPDSGPGATLGDFESMSFGLGPGFLWTPAFAEGRLAIAGKWMHDFVAENRFESDYGMLTLGWNF